MEISTEFNYLFSPIKLNDFICEKALEDFKDFSYDDLYYKYIPLTVKEMSYLKSYYDTEDKLERHESFMELYELYFNENHNDSERKRKFISIYYTDLEEELLRYEKFNCNVT